MTTTGRTPLPPGTRIGRFELVTELDRDEVSAVWAARILGARTAARAARVQVLEPRVAADLELRTLFLREARAATKIKHPGFAPVLDAGPHGSGGAHLATAYFDSASLSELLVAASERCVRIPTDVALRIIYDVLDPLAEMHAVRLETAGSTRLLHGDLRPDAIFVTLEGVTRLVASCAGAAACRQPLASVVKRLAYKAPEQIRHEGVGSSIDPRADQFALGAILWEALTGRRPFGADEAGQLVRAVLSDPVQSIATVAPDIDPGVAKIVDRLMSRDPEARYYDIEELNSELTRAAGPMIADRARVALAVRELVGPRIERRRELIRRKCASDELERAALPASEVQSSPVAAGAGPVGRVVQVPAGNTVPWAPARPPPPPRRAQTSQPDLETAAREPVMAPVVERAIVPDPPPVRIVSQVAPVRAVAESGPERAAMRPPPLPSRLPAIEDLDPPTQRTGSVKGLKAAAPVGVDASLSELSRAVVESPPPPRALSTKPIVAVGVTPAKSGADAPTEGWSSGRLQAATPRSVELDPDDEVPTARPRDLRTPAPVTEQSAGSAAEGGVADSDDQAAEPHEPDPSRTAPTLPPARRARRAKRSQLTMLALLGLGVFALSFGIVALQRRASEAPAESPPATERAQPAAVKPAPPVATEPPPSAIDTSATAAPKPTTPPASPPEPERTASPAHAPVTPPAPRATKSVTPNVVRSTPRVEPKPRTPAVKQPAAQEPASKPAPKPVDDRMLDDI